MGPKVEAACRFAERTGGRAGIGALDQAAEILRGEAGTIVAGARYEGTRGSVMMRFQRKEGVT